MSEVLLPPSLPVARMAFITDDRTAADESPVTGEVQTSEIYGTRRLRVRLEFQNLSSRNRELQIFQAFVASLQGRKGRVWIGDASYTIGGSFPATELLTNNDFSNGTTGWTVTAATLSVSDSVARLTSDGAGVPALYQSVGLTQYAPHVLRSMVNDGAQTSGLSMGPFISLGSADASNYSTSRGLRVVSGVPDSGSADYQFPLSFTSFSGYTAGAYAEVAWSSLSRCALIDNGPNALLYSDQIDNAAWTKSQATVTANAGVAPDGTTTAETITPSGVSGVHLVSQAFTVPAAAADFCISGVFRGNGYNFVLLALTEAASSTQIYQMFNLGTGAVGSTTATGAGWSNLRATIVSKGSGWYSCSLVGRKTTAATTITAQVYVFSSDSAANYAGDTTSGIYAWRVGAAQSSVPVRGAQTTTTATTGTSQTGTTLYLKGLPASTSGLLLRGAVVQIGRFRRRLTQSLDSNAAGLGTIHLSEPIYPPPSDNDPVIVHNPMGRFRLADSSIGYEIEPGVFANASMELVEA